MDGWADTALVTVAVLKRSAWLCYHAAYKTLGTSSSAVAKRPRDASCLSVVSFNSKRRVLLVTRLKIYRCMQLNALSNVEASCHKHFVVFSRNQHRIHRHLLPAMCHTQLARRWSWSTGDRVYNIWPVAGSEWRFLPTPPALFDDPVRGVPVGILLCRLARKKLEWCGYPTVKKFRRYVYSF